MNIYTDTPYKVIVSDCIMQVFCPKLKFIKRQSLYNQHSCTHIIKHTSKHTTRQNEDRNCNVRSDSPAEAT